MITHGTASASVANVVETASQAASFKTLLAAAQAAGLANALTATNNITVFAPTDAAFAKLPVAMSKICSGPKIEISLLQF